MPGNPHHLPFRPLWDHVVRRLGPLDHIDDPRIGMVTVTQWAEVAGVTRRTVERWKSTGHINLWAADRVLTKWNTHPTEVWGDDALDRITVASTLLRATITPELDAFEGARR